LGSLLPALNRARRQAIQTQCSSNLRQIGLACLNYSVQNKESLMPAIIWGDDPTSGALRDDSWGHMLVTQKLVPNPRITPNSSPIAATSILVCPATREFMTTNNLGFTNYSGLDGFERRLSYHLQPGLIVDYSYGINGPTYFPPPSTTNANSDLRVFNLPCNSIYFGKNTGIISGPLRKMSAFKRAAETAYFYDGFAWNAFNDPTARLSGGRHGKYDPRNAGNTGITNILFLDGHVEPVERRELPTTLDQFVGTRVQMRSPKYVFNLGQMH
jgi:prepilin-type processing-associated H-X9-DG protein